jgi:hypothetical protein
MPGHDERRTLLSVRLKLAVAAITGLAVPGTAASAVLATSGTAYASSPACSDTWTGNAGNGLWNTAGNWSTKKVPGTTSDVCIPTLTTADATGPISVHSIQIDLGGTLELDSSAKVATSLTNDGFVLLTGATLSAASIDNTTQDSNISTNGGSSTITSPAFSNTGTLSVADTSTLRLTDAPAQLENETLSGGGSWLDAGLLVIPSDISQITGQGTVVTVDGPGSAVQDASGGNALATLTTTGAGTAFAIEDDASLTVPHSLTPHGVVDVGEGSLTVSGTYTQASPGGTNMATGTLTAKSVVVQSGASLAGTGTVASPVTNDGTVMPEGLPLTVTGSYTQNAGGTLSEQFGATLEVSARATLTGALTVTINPKHPPNPGAFYTALTFGSRTGSFTSHTTGYTLTTNATNIQVTKQ